MTCATTTTGEPLCWGNNFRNFSSVPNPVELTTGVTAITAGNSRACMLTSTGGVRCWLSGSVTPVTGLNSGVVQLGSGSTHSCALTTGGAVKCWGSNTYGELGDGTTTPSNDPVDVVGLSSGVTSISAGFFHSCAVLSTGGVKCWGYNGRGVLGDGTTTARSTPVDVAPLGATALAVSGGNGHTCALLTGGMVKCWGRNLNGEMGNGTMSNESFTPVTVTGLSAVTALKAGGHHTCATTMAGGLKCWGHNVNGQLGDGSTTNRTTPVDVSGMTSGVVSFGVGDSNSCAIIGAGELLCWGNNSSSTVGDGTTIRRLVPVYVSGN